MKKILLLVLLLPLASIAQIIHVPANKQTIQEGIDAASPGDTVLVDTGTYFENIYFKGKNITVASRFIINGDTNYINNTIINGSNGNPDSAAVVTFSEGVDTSSILVGFTITGGKGFREPVFNMLIGGGISCYNSDAKIIHNKIIGNEVIDVNYALGGGIGAVCFSGNKWLVARNNIIKNNLVNASNIEAYGGGIYTGMNAIIDYNVIENNENICGNGTSNGGGCCFETVFSIDTVFCTNNVIKDNYGQGNYVRGAGMHIKDIYFHVSHNLIINNSLDAIDFGNGVGIWILFPKDESIINFNEIIENHGDPDIETKGGGLFIAAGEHNELLVDGNVFSKNSGFYGGGVCTWNVFNIKLLNNLFYNDSATHGGAMLIWEYDKKDEVAKTEAAKLDIGTKDSYRSSDTAQSVIINNTFADNKANSSGGALQTRNFSGKIVITNSLFWDNMAAMASDIHHLEGAYDLSIDNSDFNPDNIVGSWVGHDNIFEDPVFVDPEAGNYRIDSCYSPCCSAGTDSIYIANIGWIYSPDHDISNNPRPLPLLTRPDIGAYEVDTCIVPTVKNISTSFLEFNLYPNPFNSKQLIEFELTRPAHISITLFNALGRRIRDIHHGYYPIGRHELVWKNEGLQGGSYIIRITDGNNVVTKKIIKVF